MPEEKANDAVEAAVGDAQAAQTQNCATGDAASCQKPDAAVATTQNSEDDPQLALLKAKLNMIQACESISPGNIVRDHPLASTGAAFLCGMGVFSLFRGRGGSAPLLSSVAQISSLAAPALSLLKAVLSKGNSDGKERR